MGEAKPVRRQRVAELRRAVIAAHPDHGGTAESLQAALTALRAEKRQPQTLSAVEHIRQTPRTQQGPYATPPKPKSPRRINSAISVGISAVKIWSGLTLASAAIILLLRGVQLTLLRH